MDDIAGRVTVVTGGGSGIGRGIAHALAAAGAHVAVTDIDTAAANEVAAELTATGVQSRAYALDVTDLDAMHRVADEIQRDLGLVTILCNNAGVIIEGPLVESTPEDWQWVLSVNLFGLVHGVRAFVPRMRERGDSSSEWRGHVVNTSSMAGLAPRMDGRLAIYSASKAASVVFSEMLREELAAEGIGVTTVCPGTVRTRIWEAARNRPAALGPGRLIPEPERALTAPDPMDVGEDIVRGIRENRAYIFSSDDTAARIQARVDRLLAATEER